MATNDSKPPVIQYVTGAYSLHLLGWKAFQDLCIAVAEECLRRPVQMFLPNNDAGRDGAFIGKWEGADLSSGQSTIQCKFSSKPASNLSLSMVGEELHKAKILAEKGLATDYIILTNHSITGASELQIKTAFEEQGVGRCRVFACEWIVGQIRSSPRLRMMVPRLYGLGDLTDLLDARAYDQAQLILSAMGTDLQRLVVTDAHRKSVRAISEHNLVLLLGAPAAGKSTIGASLAIGAADIWHCGTIRATSPEDIRRHLSPGMQQFFWIDDAWGNTQYQRQSAEAWNQIFPLMQGAMRAGGRFLITSRDYIWNAARHDLKIQSLPILRQSQVIINVEELSTQERAQILYNHLKLGDQPSAFRKAVKPFLPEIAERDDFLPETARRFGSKFFLGRVPPSRESIIEFFEHPQNFLLETITNLSTDCRAAIAVVFMNGGKVRSPVTADKLDPAAVAFGVTSGSVRDQLESLNGSLLLLPCDEIGSYWTYKHPTVSDAFARYVAGSPELVEIYLRGAKPESILSEVVCAGIEVTGALVIIPESLHPLLADRIVGLESNYLVSFLSYKSSKAFSARMIALRPDLLERFKHFSVPIKEDMDASLVGKLHEQGLLPEELRIHFVAILRRAAIEEADASLLEDPSLEAIMTMEEKTEILAQVETDVIGDIRRHVHRLKDSWSSDYDPEDYFDNFEESIVAFLEAIDYSAERESLLFLTKRLIREAISEMSENYEAASSTAAPTASSTPRQTSLTTLFRDIDE